MRRRPKESQQARQERQGGMTALRLRTEDIYGGMLPARAKGDVTLLAASIARHGLLQPIVVRRNAQAGRYALICGARRLQACRMLGIREIDALLFEGDEREAVACFLEEHWCDEAVSCVDEAEIIARAGGQELSRRFALPEGMLLRRQRLSSLRERVRALVRRERLTLAQTEPLLQIAREDWQLEAASIIAQRGLGGAQARRLVMGEPQQAQAPEMGRRRATRAALRELSAVAERLNAQGIETSVSMHSQERGLCVQIVLRGAENLAGGQEKRAAREN